MKKRENLFYSNYSFNKLQQIRKKEYKKWMWIVLFGCFLLQMLPYSVSMNLASVFAGSDWSYWLNNNPLFIGIMFTVGSLVTALVAPFVAKRMSKTQNLRLMLSIGVAAACLGLMGYSINAIMTNIHGARPQYGFVITFMIIPRLLSQIGVMIFSGMGINHLLSQWWPAEKRGFALGIAFGGASFGNIWMQQMLGSLSKQFGNIAGPGYNPHGQQYLTYLIFGLMGLITGILIVLFICKKPLAPIDILDKSIISDNKPQTITKPKQYESASVLVTKSYPPYWILGIGFLILEMGIIHSINMGILIGNSTAVAWGKGNPAFYSNIMAIGGTIIGVSSLIGNILGGYLNDKLGPAKSIGIATIAQVLAIFCLMYSVKELATIYVYFFLSGISIYLFTSTPTFVSGKLFGVKESNSQSAIFGLFLAVGFALANSISGVMMGKVGVDPSTGLALNPHYMFGVQTNGNIFLLEMFALCATAIGGILIVISVMIIAKKGIKGLNEYNASKFTIISFFKFSFWLLYWKIKFFIKDEVLIDQGTYKKPALKVTKDYFHWAKAKYPNLKRVQLVLLTYIYLYQYLDDRTILENINETDFTTHINSLVEQGLVKEEKYFNGVTVYSYNGEMIDVNNKYNKIIKEQVYIRKTLMKMDNKKFLKLKKINQKIESTQAQELDQKIENKNQIKYNKLKSKLDKKIAWFENNGNCLEEWKRYQLDYSLNQQLINLETIKNKQTLLKEEKLKKLNKSIMITNYVYDYEKHQKIIGNINLIDYYKDPGTQFMKMVVKQSLDIVEKKLMKLQSK